MISKLRILFLFAALTFPLAFSATAYAQTATEGAAAQTEHRGGGEANLVLPDLSTETFQGINGRTLLLSGLGVCVLGLVFGMTIFTRLKNMPVHRSMLEVSELIYETCKTYLITQGKFILLLEVFIGVIMLFYFGVLQHFDAMKVTIILLFSLIGIGGSYGVAWFGIRVNTFANSRAAFGGLKGEPRCCLVRHSSYLVRELARRVCRTEVAAVSDLRDSAAGGHEHRHAPHQRRAVHDAVQPALHPG